MKSLLFLIITFFCLTLSAQSVLACRCLEYDTPVCAAYWRSDAVFVGQLRDITLPDKEIKDGLPTATLHFIVEQPFRGISSATIDVSTPYGTSCDMPFSKGRRYLIYAYRDSETTRLHAGPCDRSTELAHATEDLNYIRALSQNGVKETIAGRIARDMDESIKGSKVEVRNGSRTYEATTDEKGDYSVQLSGPGSYTVKVFLLGSFSAMTHSAEQIPKVQTTDELTTIEYTVELGKSKCDYRQLNVFPVDLHANAELAGSVLTLSGTPVDKGAVYLIKDKDDLNRWRDAKIDANGSFKFEGIKAGEYFLVLNPDNRAPDQNDAPYPRTFYPNSPDDLSATKIAITEGAKLENVTLRVGPPWKARTVSGSVVWKDGSSAPGAMVSLYESKRYMRMVKVDEKGRFSFELYGDFQYALEARMWGQRRGQSKRTSIDNSSNLTLVLMPE